MEDISRDIEVLRSESDPSKINNLALKLSATKKKAVLDVILELIRRPGLEGERGTLVHCLGEFDCVPLFGLLIELQLEGNWEVAHEAYDLLVGIDLVGSVSADVAYEKLLAAVGSAELEDWRRGQVEALLAMFE